MELKEFLSESVAHGNRRGNRKAGVHFPDKPDGLEVVDWLISNGFKELSSEHGSTIECYRWNHLIDKAGGGLVYNTGTFDGRGKHWVEFGNRNHLFRLKTDEDFDAFLHSIKCICSMMRYDIDSSSSSARRETYDDFRDFKRAVEDTLGPEILRSVSESCKDGMMESVAHGSRDNRFPLVMDPEKIEEWLKKKGFKKIEDRVMLCFGSNDVRKYSKDQDERFYVMGRYNSNFGTHWIQFGTVKDFFRLYTGGSDRNGLIKEFVYYQPYKDDGKPFLDSHDLKTWQEFRNKVEETF